jgi:hypothetical protein
MRITAPDTPVPYSPPLEDAFRPDAGKILEAARFGGVLKGVIRASFCSSAPRITSCVFTFHAFTFKDLTIGNYLPPIPDNVMPRTNHFWARM